MPNEAEVPSLFKEYMTEEAKTKKQHRMPFNRDIVDVNELVTQVARETGVLKEATEQVINMTMLRILESLLEGKNVYIPNLMSFEVSTIKNRLHTAGKNCPEFVRKYKISFLASVKRMMKKAPATLEEFNGDKAWKAYLHYKENEVQNVYTSPTKEKVETTAIRNKFKKFNTLGPKRK